MLNRLRVLLIFCATLASFSAHAEVPFWKQKEKVFARIQNREIIVSVTSKDGTLHVSGGGHCRAPREFVFARAQEFARFPKMSQLIETSHFDAKTKILSLKVGIFGLTDNLKIRLNVNGEAEPLQIQYEVIEGALAGLKGVFEFSDIDAHQTEVGIAGQLQYNKGVRRTLMGIGLEVAFQRMATGLRSFVEAEWSKQLGGLK